MRVSWQGREQSAEGLKGHWEVRAQIQPRVVSPQALPGDVQEDIAVVWADCCDPFNRTWAGALKN